MPLSLDQQFEDQRKKAQQGGLQGFAKAGPALGGAGPEGGGIDFEGLFPTISRSPIQSAAPIRDTSGLQFNPEFAQRNLGLQRQEADLGLTRQQNIQSVDQNYERSVERAQQMQEAARKRLIERMSGQGILASGITGQKQGELNMAHTGYLDDLGHLRATNLSGVESDYANMMNTIALQREGLFGEQQRVEEARRLEAARIAAEQQAQAQAAAQQQALMQQQAQLAAQRQAEQMALLQAIQAQNYQAQQIAARGYEQPATSSPQPTNRTFTNQELEQTYRNATSAGQGHRDRSMQAIQHWFNTDPVWAQIAANTANQYGRGADMASMVDFFYNPYNWVPGLSQGGWPAGVL